jgi:putative chitinase
MNQTQFQAAGISAELAARWYPHITAAMTKFGITKTEDQAMFIAQVAHESAGFSSITESFNYSVQALIQLFVPNHLSMDQAKSLGRQVGEKVVPPVRQTAIANLVYHGRYGNKAPGDGWKYRGQGLIQTTFLDNYLACGKAIGVELVATPELLEQPSNAALSAAWFYTSRGCLRYSGNVAVISQLINGGNNGLADRTARYQTALKALTA